jgi:DNA polymerase I-like protein with 3'-5' exonuclease and polymerase domains
VLQPIVIDFETHPIQGRPNYPPKPVGVAIWDMAKPEDTARYYAWGHEAGDNNSTPEAGRRAVQEAWESGRPLLFHNSKFDVEVATVAMGLPMLEWTRFHDTMFLAYLNDPHSPRLGLKELADDLLAMPPEERDAVAEWVWERRVELAAAWPQYGTVKKSQIGAWIFAAPGGLVGSYAIGDVIRTGRLFRELFPVIDESGMMGAYDRERKVMPIFMANEQEGMRADVARLRKDIAAYDAAFRVAEDWLRSTLKADGLNFDADDDVASVLMTGGHLTTAASSKLVNGRISMSKDHLTPDKFADPRVASVLGYRNRLKTCLDTFMRPWLRQAEMSGGIITTNWNQVRGNEKGGTRSGRPSTNNHNFLNISKDFEGRASDGFQHPEFLTTLHLPLCRRYVLPDEGGVWLHRDFSGQELRIFADLEQGQLFEAYLENPALDPHDWLKGVIAEVTGVTLERTRVKNVTFSRLYGGGLGAIERQGKCADRAEAQSLSDAHDAGLPGRVVVVNRIKRLHRMRLPIRTLGGRLYFAAPPGPDGRSKDYQLINYYCQGGAADYTKETLCEWDDMNRSLKPEERSRFLVTVYDELNVSSPAPYAKVNMGRLAGVMERPGRLGVEVPMLSDGKAGLTWGDQVKEDKVDWESFL